ncbi:hypothetical protein [Trinickia fusca]|uniref:Uncharacterized protein n=1 Tax=Trinickia fusca TaxID=2419777 RepID=A0A494XPM8_9BURK|nr:hypothetical protein [Trinickia fusca]RKP50736.1 hypothetical protein D7S89_06540 [Trinickia fusca]
MPIAILRRFAARLGRWVHATPARINPTKEVSTLLDIDPFWHGDHWQNLLASPMDARHYVMEDWAVPFSEENQSSIPSPRDRRIQRRSH